MHHRIREPQPLPTQTVPRDQGVPELGDGEAGQEGADDAPGAVGGEESDHGPGDDAHAAGRENEEVLEEDGGFGAENRGVVEGDCGPEGLVFVNMLLDGMLELGLKMYRYLELLN